MFHIQPGKTFALLSENCIVLRTDRNGGITVHQSWIQNLYTAHDIIHGIVNALYQGSAPGRNRNRTLWNIESPNGDSIGTCGFVTSLKLKLVFLTLLLFRLGFCGRIKHTEHVFVLVGVIGFGNFIYRRHNAWGRGFVQFVKKMFPKRLNGSKNYPSILRIHSNPRYKVKKTVSTLLWVVVKV